MPVGFCPTFHYSDSIPIPRTDGHKDVQHFGSSRRNKLDLTHGTRDADGRFRWPKWDADSDNDGEKDGLQTKGWNVEAVID